MIGGGSMPKKYLVWWHSYVNDISHDAATLKDISNSVTKALKNINELKILEQQGKIKVKYQI